jgi:PKD repeat protein
MKSPKKRSKCVRGIGSIQGIESLEGRLLFSSATLDNGVIALKADADQNNTFIVRLMSDGQIFASAANISTYVPSDEVQTVIVYQGNQNDRVFVGANVSTPVEVMAPDGTTSFALPGQRTDLAPPATSANQPSATDPAAGTSPGGTASAPPADTISIPTVPPATGTTPAADPGSAGTAPAVTPSSSAPSSGSDSPVASSTAIPSIFNPTTGTGSIDGSTPLIALFGPTTMPTVASGGSPDPSNPGNILPSIVTPTTIVPVDPNAPAPVITVTDGASILPGESVHVEAVDSSFGNGDILHSTISWNFGDAGSSYNTIAGFNAAHAYDTPGTYTVTLTITNQDGLSGTAIQQVTVLQDSRPAIYVSASGDDSNDGSTPNDPVQSVARVNQLITSNTRILFHDGDTFASADTLYINGLSDVYIGSYGQGAQPVIMYNGPTGYNQIVYIENSSEGITIQGLTFDSIYSDFHFDDAIPSGIRLTGSNITIRNNTFLDVLDGMDLQNQPSNVLIQDNSAPSLTGLRAYFTWVQGTDIAIVGNTVVNSTREHIVRVAGATRIQIADNNLSNVSGAAWGDPEDGIKGAITIQYGMYAYVTGNTVPSGPVTLGPLTLSSAGPQSNSLAIFDMSVFENNTFDDGVLIQPGAHNAVFRNNVLYQTADPGFYINAFENLYGRQVQNVSFLNNTVIDSGQTGGFLKLVSGVALNLVMDGNLFVAPNLITGDDQAVVYVSDTSLQSFTEIKNNIWPVPQVYNYALGGYFYVAASAGLQSGYLTPAAWEALGLPVGDVYSNVTLSGTAQVTIDGVTGGANLPISQ